MADLALLFQLKAQNQASPAIKAVQTDIARLKSQTSADFKGMQASGTQSLNALSKSLSEMGGQLPLVGGAVNGLSGQMSTLAATSGSTAGVVGIVAAGFIATAAAAAALGQALFASAQSAAEFQGKMFDLSQQTGVAVETLSALEVLAKTTGGSIEGIAASLGIFQKNLEEAQDSTTKQSALFKQLRVDTKDTESALRDTLTALAKMPEGFSQTAKALELFGRGGKSMLAILKEMGGDLDSTIDKFREMGILISESDAKAADEFNDQLAIMGFQLRSIGAVIGKEVMPVVASAVRDLSKALNDNRDVINDLATAASFLANVFTGPLKGAIFAVSFAFAGAKPIIDALADSYSILARAANFAANAIANARAPFPSEGGASGHIGGVTGGVNEKLDVGGVGSIGGPRKKGSGGRGGGRTQDTGLQGATSAAALAERESLLLTAGDVAENKRALDEQVRNLEEFTARAIELADKKHDAAIVRVNAEQEALDAALQRGAIKQAEYDEKSRQLAIENKEAQQKNDEETFELKQELNRKTSEAQIAAKNREIEIAEDADQRQIDRIKLRVDRGLLLESQGERQIAEIVAEALERRKNALQEELDAYSTTLQRRADINAQLIQLDGNRAQAAEDAAQRIEDARKKEAFAAGEKGPVDVGQTQINAGIPPPEALSNLVASAVSAQGAFAGLGTAISGAFGLGKEGAEVFGGMMTSAFNSLAQAVGQSVQAFVLLGNAGIGLKKLTAIMISEIAKMAAVQAIWELAQGIAMLALNFFWPDPKLTLAASAHFKAAAVYGGLAVVAAGAGRLVAGGSFAGEGGGGGGSGRGAPGGSAAPGTRSAPTVQDINRRGTSQPVVNVVIRGEATEGFRYVVEKAATESVRSNGVFRKIQNGEDV